MRQYKIIAATDGNDGKGRRFNLMLGDIRCTGNPRDTYEFLAMETIGASFGLDVRVVTASSFFRTLTSNDPGFRRLLSYEHVHHNIWWKLTKRGEILAARRKAQS